VGSRRWIQGYPALSTSGTNERIGSSAGMDSLKSTDDVSQHVGFRVQCGRLTDNELILGFRLAVIKSLHERESQLSCGYIIGLEQRPIKKRGNILRIRS
jgi:hypothetical protein